MVRRSELTELLKHSKAKSILAELPTGYGKTKLALDWIDAQKHKSKILIVVPRLVLMDSWKAEFTKWDYLRNLTYTTFTTYISFPKHVGKWDIIVFDEVHHLSDRCREYLDGFSYKKAILLSATVTDKRRWQLRYAFPGLETIKVYPRQAIEEEILPDPKVYLIPMTLDYVHKDFIIVRNPKAKNSITVDYKDRFKYIRRKDIKLVIKCTQREYYADMTSLILKYKKKIYIERWKNLYLHKCGERLKWLSAQKTEFVAELLKKIGRKRSLVFCNNIEQTESLGRYCINSKNKEAMDFLESFNNGKINHITACNMLDEGVNLVNCQIGIFANINSSERMQKQRLGRILRHKNPIIIIPYYINTREEEIIEDMKEDYNSQLITVINNLNELVL